ncbi:MAG: SLC45 family MFS transporter [Bacteroidales bacterium]|nr:SLC45 family MFS transporter [Bacteroidales bacterium]
MSANNMSDTAGAREQRNLSFRALTDISFGFFGVQIAYALQSANISRIFATLGADPHDLSFFWVLPPLMGMIVQPIIGTLSDRTWTRYGRRLPYLFAGSAMAVIVMCLLPNAGGFNFSVAAAMAFGLVALMFLDTSINMAMQPFKMLVGDMVNERQKGLAYSIQSFLCNAGSLMGFVFPFLFTWIGISNTADEGVVPDSVIYSFYVGALILILCVIYTTLRVKEMPPKEYAEFHGIKEEKKDTGAKKHGMMRCLMEAPREFWTVGLVQFFCWAAFLYMWTYMPGAIADNVWGTTDVTSEDYQEAGNWVGILYAVQAVGSVLWAMVIPRFRSIKMAYIVSLLLGGVGFVMTMFVHDQYLMFVPLTLVGFAWAAMLAIPFTLLTNALEGSDSIGTYLGLFNCAICMPQIVAALCGGAILSVVGSQPAMLGVAGMLLVCGAIAVVLFVTRKNNR